MTDEHIKEEGLFSPKVRSNAKQVFSVECPYCGSLVGGAIEKVSNPAGYHLKGRCPHCRKEIWIHKDHVTLQAADTEEPDESVYPEDPDPTDVAYEMDEELQNWEDWLRRD